MIDLTPPCRFSLRNFTSAEMAFGAGEQHYLSRAQLGDWYHMDHPTPFHRAANALFRKHAALADFGLTVKHKFDSDKVLRNIRALMVSWSPKHEIKIGTVAVALANWCDYTP